MTPTALQTTQQASQSLPSRHGSKAAKLSATVALRPEPKVLAHQRPAQGMRVLQYMLDPLVMAEDYVATQDDWEGLDEWQREYLLTDANCILMCSRQVGKSTCAGLKIVQKAVTRPNSLILVISPKLDQSKELYRKCLRIYKALGKPIPIVSVTTLSLELANGSRIICLPDKEDTTRGYSGVTFIVIDEGSRVDDPTFYAVRPMLAVSGGHIDLLSTPNGDRGFFIREWNDGTDYIRFKVTADAVPRISPEFLRQERRALGESLFRQEYYCAVLPSTGAVFRAEDIEAMFGESSVVPIFPDLVAQQQLAAFDLGVDPTSGSVSDALFDTNVAFAAMSYADMTSHRSFDYALGAKREEAQERKRHPRRHSLRRG